MKYKFITIVLLLVIFPINCFASDKTLTRTKDNLLVPDRVEVTPKNTESILKTPAVNSEEKLYDFADIYTDKEEKELYEAIDNYIDNSNIELIIVTTKDLKGFSTQDYTINFHNYNMFKNDALTFLIYVGEEKPKLYIDPCGGRDSRVLKIYTDDRINGIFKYIYPDLKEKRYFEGTNKYINTMERFYKLSDSSYYLNKKGEIVKRIPWIELIILGIGLTVVAIILFVYKLTPKTKGLFNYDENINESTMMVKLNSDEAVQSVSNEKINL